MDNPLETIHTELERARGHLTELERAMARLEQAGIYPAQPTREAWEPRDNGQEYMYHYFGTGRDGHYEGPDGKRKVYVGNNPARIARARRLALNRQSYDRAANTARRLSAWIAGSSHELKMLALNSQHWPRLNLEELGPDLGAGGPPESPKEESTDA